MRRNDLLEKLFPALNTFDVDAAVALFAPDAELGDTSVQQEGGR